MDVKLTEKKLNELDLEILRLEEEGTINRFPGMTYQQGIKAVIDYILGGFDEELNPMAD